MFQIRLGVGDAGDRIPTSALAQSRPYPDMLRSEGVGELRIVQEHVVRQGIQEIDQIDLVLS